MMNCLAIEKQQSGPACPEAFESDGIDADYTLDQGTG
jgi:hypothetical protein